jgi:hypothetical protein
MKVKTFIGTDAAGVDKQVNGWLAESKVQVRRTSTAFKRFRDRGKDALTGRTAHLTSIAEALACHNGVRGARRRCSNLSPNCKPALHSGKRNGPPDRPDRAYSLLPKRARPMIRVFGQDRIDLAYSDRRNREGPDTFHPSCVLARIAAHAEKSPRPRSEIMTTFFLLGLFGLQSAVMTAPGPGL